MSDNQTTRFSIRSDDEGVPERIVVEYGSHGHAPCLEIALPDGRWLLIGHGSSSNGYEVGLYSSEQDFYDDEENALIALVDGDNLVVFQTKHKAARCPDCGEKPDEDDKCYCDRMKDEQAAQADRWLEAERAADAGEYSYDAEAAERQRLDTAVGEEAKRSEARQRVDDLTGADEDPADVEARRRVQARRKTQRERYHRVRGRVDEIDDEHPSISEGHVLGKRGL